MSYVPSSRSLGVPPRPPGPPSPLPTLPPVPAWQPTAPGEEERCHGSPAGKVADTKQHPRKPTLPVLNPRVWLAGPLSVVFGNKTPAAGPMRGPDHPAFAHVGLLRRVNVDEVAGVDHEFVDVLGLVLEEGPQRLGEHAAGSGCCPEPAAARATAVQEMLVPLSTGRSDRYCFPLCKCSLMAFWQRKKEDTTAFAVCVKMGTWFS